jgi:hypothetical protein
MQPLLDALRDWGWLLGLLGLVVALVGWQRARRRPAPGTPSDQPITRGLDDPALDTLLAAQMQRLDALATDLATLAGRTRQLEANAHLAVQRIGIVRFNPFEDTGGNQSFALALLDGDANGVVLSSLHSRQATRVYLKTILGGRCEAALSEEEAEALRQAGVSI